MEDKMKWTKQKKNNNMFPLLLIGGVLIIIAVMFSTISKQNKNYSNNSKVTKSGSKTETQINEGSFTGVIKNVDEITKDITFTNIKDGQDFTLEYTGGTNFVNKYGKVSVLESIPVGEIVDITYKRDASKLTQVKVSDQAFHYQGINNWYRDKEKNSIVVADSNYRYSNEIVVSSKGRLLSIDDLDETDEISVKGFDRQIYSIIVTRGHGTLRFENYDDFVGGIAFIGSRYILPVVKDLIVTAREGDYDITLEIGKFKGTVPITAIEGEEVVVNMSEFKKPVVKKGLVKFNITPEGADLYIDNLPVDYEKDISLDYGEHNILVSLGGYTTYSGTVEVEEEEKAVNIDLVEASKETNTEEEDSQSNDRDNNDTDNNTVDNNQETNNENNENNEGSSNNQGTSNNQEVDVKNYIHVESPEGASVYFNGEFKGMAPVSFPKVMGTQYITLIKSGYATKTYTVEVSDDNKDVKLNFTDMAIQN